MSEDLGTGPFPVCRSIDLFGSQVVGGEPDGSRSDTGRSQLSAGLRRLAAQVAALEAWWQDAEPVLAEDLSLAFRRLILEDMRARIVLLESSIGSLDAMITAVAVGDAYEGAEHHVQVLMHHARRWNLRWALAQERETCIAADPLDDPRGFLIELERRLHDQSRRQHGQDDGVPR